MNMMLFVTSARGPKSIDFSKRNNQLWLFISALFVSALLLAAGFALGKYLTPLNEAIAKSDGRWYSSLIDERNNLEEISRQTTNDLNALAVSLGRMEARSIRLDALGSRLASLAGLGEDEFDFSETPALGGPEDDISSVSSQLPDLLDRFTDLQRQIEDREHKFLLMESILMDQELSKQVVPEGKPVKSGWLSSHYGKRSDPFTGKTSWHAGIDFAGKKGSDVVAVAAGIVTLAQKKHGYGRLIEISHGNGYLTRYAHNSELVVGIGDKVEKGQVIAKMGSSGRSTGPHVHFEVVKNGKVVNPRKYILGAHIK
jgi:murein DD-endopeptidase MepM/ murein hydrolase activator NlpD